MFTKVLVAVAGTHADAAAVSAARAVAPHAELHLVHVYADGNEPIAPEQHYRAKFRSDAQRVLQTAAADASASHLHAVPGYSASEGIKRLATSLDVGLIVLGSSERGIVGRILLGDVSRAVLHGAPCPVLCVAHGQSPAAPPKRIGVAYDGSPESELALDLGVQLTRAHDGELEIVEAVDVGVIPAVWGVEVAEFLGSVLAPEEARIADVCERLDVPVEGHAVSGAVRSVVGALAARVDLIVCGSRTWGAARRVVLGSTADRLVHDSPCPVLVVPRGAQVDAGEADLAAAPEVVA